MQEIDKLTLRQIIQILYQWIKKLKNIYFVENLHNNAPQNKPQPQKN